NLYKCEFWKRNVAFIARGIPKVAVFFFFYNIGRIFRSPFQPDVAQETAGEGDDMIFIFWVFGEEILFHLNFKTREYMWYAYSTECVRTLMAIGDILATATPTFKTTAFMGRESLHLFNSDFEYFYKIKRKREASVELARDGGQQELEKTFDYLLYLQNLQKGRFSCPCITTVFIYDIWFSFIHEFKINLSIFWEYNIVLVQCLFSLSIFISILKYDKKMVFFFIKSIGTLHLQKRYRIASVSAATQEALLTR
ncbi:hypothetical protein ACJX0J_008469, partial [Zea mays]